MDNNNSKIYVAAALALFLALGFYAGYVFFYNRGYEQARSDIKTRLQDKRIVEPTPTQVLVVSGKIASIGTNQFILESQLPYDPTLPESEQQKTISKTVLITPATTITVRTVTANNIPPKPGEAFRPFIVSNTKTDLSSLKVGDAVVVQANQDISNLSSFEAASVSKNGQ